MWLAYSSPSVRCCMMVMPSRHRHWFHQDFDSVATIYVSFSPIWSLNMDWTDNHIYQPTHAETLHTVCTFHWSKLYLCSLNNWFCLFPKFQKLFSFTWSSFHVYGSLLSNQIETSNAHKNWIVWHLRLKSNICMDNQHWCLVIAICVILKTLQEMPLYVRVSASYDVT